MCPLWSQVDETQAVTDVVDAVEQTYRTKAERLWRALVLLSSDRELASDAVGEAFAQAIAARLSMILIGGLGGPRSTSRAAS